MSLVHCALICWWWYLLLISTVDIYWWYLLMISTYDICWWYQLLISTDEIYCSVVERQGPISISVRLFVLCKYTCICTHANTTTNIQIRVQKNCGPHCWHEQLHEVWANLCGHSHLLPSVWQWSCHYLFLRLRSVVAGIPTPSKVLAHCAIAAACVSLIRSYVSWS